MSFLTCDEPMSNIALKNVPLIRGNQLICFCGAAAVVKDKRTNRCGCAKNLCKLIIDKPAMVEWVSSGALPDSSSYILPICKTCEAVTLYAPLRNPPKEGGLNYLEPLFKCNCRSGKINGTYYSFKEFPEFYKQFNMDKLPIDTRARQMGGQAVISALNLANFPDA